MNGSLTSIFAVVIRFPLLCRKEYFQCSPQALHHWCGKCLPVKGDKIDQRSICGNNVVSHWTFAVQYDVVLRTSPQGKDAILCMGADLSSLSNLTKMK